MNMYIKVKDDFKDDFGEEKIRAPRTEGFFVQISVLLGKLLNILSTKYN